jgi:hypothetical protein
MSDYQFSDGLLDKVYKQADDYTLHPPGEGEFVISEMVHKDKVENGGKGRDVRWWRRTLNAMADKGVLEKRYGLHPDLKVRALIFREADGELPDQEQPV